MSGRIKWERISPRPSFGAEGAFVGRVLLPGEVEGVVIRHCVAQSGRPLVLEEERGRTHVRVFLNGSGRLTIGPREYVIGEMAVAIAGAEAPVTLEPATEPFEFLDIVRNVDPADERHRVKRAEQLPYFLRYSECQTYREEIKSAKTVSRTLVPPDLLPRFAMGSVQTAGPDLVAAHQHAMLEQYFFGLAGNSCYLRADDEEIRFGANMLVHIPLGSLHGVRVESSHALHYLWLDFFRRQEDTSYISQVHIPVAE